MRFWADLSMTMTHSSPATETKHGAAIGKTFITALCKDTQILAIITK